MIPFVLSCCLLVTGLVLALFQRIEKRLNQFNYNHCILHGWWRTPADQPIAPCKKCEESIR